MNTTVKDVMTTWVISGILHRRDQARARGVTAGDLMTTAVVAIRPEDTVEYAAKLTYDRGVKRLQAAERPGDRYDVLANLAMD